MPSKEIRKIVRIGNVSLGVILPISWLRYYDLKHGDSVEIISNGCIEIRPQKKNNSGGCYLGQVI